MQSLAQTFRVSQAATRALSVNLDQARGLFKTTGGNVSLFKAALKDAGHPDMFTLTLLLLMAVAIAVLVVLVIYLVDRFNGLERETQHLMRSLQDQQAQARPAGPYAGLSGKALWDTLSGEAGTPMDEATMEGVRKRYRLILGEHIGFVFNEGVSDQRRGLDSVPASTRVVRTPKTQVESWLPPESVAEIYRCGQGYASHDPAQLPELRQRLKAHSAQALSKRFEQAGLPYAPIVKPEELFDDPHLQATGGLADVVLTDGPRAGETAKAALLPFTMGGERLGVRNDPPRRGQDHHRAAAGG